MTRGRKRALVRISQQRREHVIKRLKERFNEDTDIKAFFLQIKNKKYEVVGELKGNRLLCLSNFFGKPNPLYFILRYDDKKKEVATVLTEEMVQSKYSYLFEGDI